MSWSTPDVFGIFPPSAVLLEQWNIIFFKADNCHACEIFIGDSVNDGIARRSSPITHCDEDTGKGLTQSDSIYQTVCKPCQISFNARLIYWMNKINKRPHIGRKLSWRYRWY